MSDAITHVVGQTDYCRECGMLSDVYETPQGIGPYCGDCVDDVAEQEERCLMRWQERRDG